MTQAFNFWKNMVKPRGGTAHCTQNECRVLFTGMWPFYGIRFTFGKVRVKLCFFQLIKVHHVHKNGSWGETCGFLKLRWWYYGGDKKGGTLWQRVETLFIHSTGKKQQQATSTVYIYFLVKTSFYAYGI